MQATLEFKWYKYGLLHWTMPFIISLAFFVFMMIVTALQISSATPKDKGPFPVGHEPDLEDRNPEPSAADIERRYLLDWRWFFILTIVFGVTLILLDLRRILISYKSMRSPYLIMRAVAYVLSVVGCSIFIHYKPGTSTPDNGPSQIWYMSYGILALYLNMLFELRVFRPFGVPVYIILKIMWRVRWFFMILALFVISFSHALLHLLHTRSYDICAGGVCKDDYPDTFPKNFGRALIATTFFLAGRYEPIGNSLDSGSASFLAMMVVFFTFTSLLILNILIAWMGHAFTQCKEEGKEAWHRQWSEVIADVELSFMSNSSLYNRNLFPDYIYYGASEKIAAQHESIYSNIASKSNLSLENRFLFENLEKKHDQTHKAQREIKLDIKTITDGHVKQDNDTKMEHARQDSDNKMVRVITDTLGKSDKDKDSQLEDLKNRLECTERMLLRVLKILDPEGASEQQHSGHTLDGSASTEAPASETSSVEDGRSTLSLPPPPPPPLPSQPLSSTLHRHRSHHNEYHEYSIDRPYYPPFQDREDLSAHVHDSEDDDPNQPSMDQEDDPSSSVSRIMNRVSALNALMLPRK
ncbi:MAG: hypothetical protein J3Q66DRAFT_325804 [Benniella sp.]|nr:MAG: hypothetical protein J3Q66DRAFT_325804 [Benniella sp.]